MSRKNLSIEKLNMYFKNKKANINIVSRETGISKPTISRYIKKIGYESYSEFLYEHREKEIINTYNLLEIIKKYKYIYVASSKSSIILKEYMLIKLNSLGIKAKELKEKIEKNALILFLSLSGSSRSLEKTVEQYSQQIVCVSTIKPIIKNKNLKSMIVKEANFGRKDDKQIMLSIDGLIDFIKREIK